MPHGFSAWILFISFLRARSLGEDSEPMLNIRSVWGDMGTVDRRQKICLYFNFFFLMIRFPDGKNRHIGPMLERTPASYQKLAGLWYTQRHTHTHVEEISWCFFIFLAEKPFSSWGWASSLSALCSLPRLMLPGSTASPSCMYDLKGITYYFNYLSLINWCYTTRICIERTQRKSKSWHIAK